MKTITNNSKEPDGDDVKKGKINQRSIFYSGNFELLKKSKVAVFASRNIPQSTKVHAERLLEKLTEHDHAFIGGWQSPFESSMLKRLAISEKGIIFFTSLGIRDQSVYNYLRKPMDAGRLLIVSFFEKNQKATNIMSQKRNEIISDIADSNLFMYVRNGGNLDMLIQRLNTKGRTPLILNSPSNSDHFQNSRVIDFSNVQDIIVENILQS